MCQSFRLASLHVSTFRLLSYRYITVGYITDVVSDQSAEGASHSSHLTHACLSSSDIEEVIEQYLWATVISLATEQTLKPEPRQHQTPLLLSDVRRTKSKRSEHLRARSVLRAVLWCWKGNYLFK